MLPEDWQTLPVQTLVEENVLEKPLDGNHGNIHPKNCDYVSHGIPFVMANNIQGGQIDLYGCKFIRQEQADKLQKGFAVSGDVLLTHKGTVGNTAIVPRLSTDYIMLTPQVTYYRVRDETRLDRRFLRHYFDSSSFQNLFKALAGGGTRAYLGISKQLALPIVKPPIREQRAIAAALSDIDALLDSLTRLIAKKRDLKRAAMQQLLTGQTRLPGFSGAREEKRLGELGEITGAGVDKKIRSNEIPVRLLNYMDVYKQDFLKADDFWHEVTAKPDQARRCAVQRGDIFFTPTSEVRDDIGHSAVAIEDAPDVVYSYHVVRFRLSEEWDISFRTYVFKTKHFLDQASTQCEGSGTRYVITLPKFRSMTVRYPTDVAEQAAIGKILSDMDAELAVLEARLTKTFALKQAMMSELLTGKTRLPTL